MSLMLWQVAALLLLQSCVSVMTVSSAEPGLVDLSEKVSVGTIEHSCRTLLVFGYNNSQFAEPSIRFEQSCPNVEYNAFGLRYKLSLPVQIAANTLEKPLGKEAKVGNVTISGIEVLAGAELVETGSNQVSVEMRLLDSGKAAFIFLCATFERCQQIKDALQWNPKIIQQTVRFVVLGRVSGIPVKFAATSCDSGPSLFKCDGWIPVLRRADNSFSFNRGWDEYVAGFGSSDLKYYWMGLEALHRATSRSGVKCQVRVEGKAATDVRVPAKDLWKGKLHWEEWDQFRVSGSQENYKLHLGKVIGESSGRGGFFHNGFGYCNGSQFSTMDRDNDDRSSVSCALECRAGPLPYGCGGGWWYCGGNDNSYPCSRLFLTRTPIIADVFQNEEMSSSAMMFKCS